VITMFELSEIMIKSKLRESK